VTAGVERVLEGTLLDVDVPRGVPSSKTRSSEYRRLDGSRPFSSRAPLEHAMDEIEKEGNPEKS
jgi:hypothetical protein